MSVIVNGVAIGDAEIDAEVQYHRASSLAAARRLATEVLVIRQLVLQEAKSQGLLSDDEEKDIQAQERSITRLLEQEIAVPEADQTSCERYYTNNSERFIDTKSGKQLPYALVAVHIREYLAMRSLRQGMSHYIALLLRRAEIRGFEFDEQESQLL